MENGGHSCKPFEISDAGEYNEFSYTANSRPTLFFEYYTNLINGDLNKEFTYIFKPFQSIDNLAVNLQIPAAAKDFVVKPTANETRTDERGFTYNIYNYSSVEPNQSLVFDVAYTKSGNQPSVVKEQSIGTQPNSQVGNSSTLFNNRTFLVLALGGAFIFFTIGVWSFYRISQKYYQRYQDE